MPCWRKAGSPDHTATKWMLMTGRFVLALWDDCRTPLELIEPTGANQPAEFVVLGSRVDPSMLALIERTIINQPLADAIVACDPSDLARRSSLRGELPPLLSLIAASPTCDPAVAVSVRAARNQIASAPAGIGWLGLTMKVAGSGPIHFVENAASAVSPLRRWPSLTTPTFEPTATQFRDFIASLPIPTAKPNSPDTISIRAGLLLLNDCFDASHSLSQSMEGHQNADYWHAILHRREPDYGNAKYWFRQVGRHANFAELAQQVTTMISRAAGSLETKLRRWLPRLVTASGWEPFAFVDLCEVAESDAELRSWCEEVQFVEMLLLLESTYLSALC